MCGRRRLGPPFPSSSESIVNFAIGAWKIEEVKKWNEEREEEEDEDGKESHKKVGKKRWLIEPFSGQLSPRLTMLLLEI